jgi:SH3-like domain-containing protein
MANPGVRLARWILPWLALALFVNYVWGITVDFRKGLTSARTPAAVTTQTVDATSTPVSGMTGTVIAEGSHLRDYPASGGAVLKDLAKGVTFEVVEKRGDWYRIKDSTGNIGWVTADKKYVEVTQQ